MAEAGECGCVLGDEEIRSCYCVLEPLVQAVGRREAVGLIERRELPDEGPSDYGLTRKGTTLRDSLKRFFPKDAD